VTDSEGVAAALLEAERTRVPIPPPTDASPDMTIAGAYAVQQAGRTLRLAAGARPVGHKIGLTSAAMQEMLGVDQPDFGYLTDAMVSPSGTVLQSAELIAPRAEAEVAFLIGAELAGPGLGVADVLAATEGVAAAIEVIDSRVADWRIQIADTIADNASCGHVVIGEWRALEDLDLAAVAGRMTVRDAGGAEETVEGRGDAVLGHPAAAIAWLARALDEFGGGTIAAGDVVIPGAFARALPVAAGAVAEAAVEGIGEVRVSFDGGQGGGA
jgi:2-oxo-3-hexenedioate decarboxylase/2-keto-4-pentenoate hydratase